LESLRQARNETNTQDNPKLKNLSALRHVEAFCYLNIINNDALDSLFEPLEGSNWASALALKVTNNDRLCGKLDDFFPLDPNSHVRTIENNCLNPG
jgi:hypothetical protein